MIPRLGILPSGVLCGLLLTRNAAADAPPVGLNDLRTPSAPGFVLLGVEPTSIEKPTTPKAFAASLISAISAGDVLPKNYAVEVAPYWLVSHPELTFSEYYAAGPGQTFLQTVSFSIATSTAEDPSLKLERTGLAFGARAQLLSGGASSALKKLIVTLREQQKELLQPDAEDEAPPAGPGGAQGGLDAESKALATERDRLRGEREKLKTDEEELEKFRDALKPEELRKKEADLARRQEALHADQTDLDGRESERAAKLKRHAAELAAAEKKAETVREKLKTTSLAIQAEDKNRVGLTIDVAGGAALDFLDGDVDTGAWRRWGAWITPAYRLDSPKLDILAVGRFVRDSIKEKTDADVGGRLLLQTGRFGISGEYLQRFGIGDKKDKTYRLSGNLEYQVADNAYLTATFGKNFSDQTTPAGNLISLLGLNIGFGSTPLLGVGK